MVDIEEWARKGAVFDLLAEERDCRRKLILGDGLVAHPWFKTACTILVAIGLLGALSAFTGGWLGNGSYLGVFMFASLPMGILGWFEITERRQLARIEAKLASVPAEDLAAAKEQFGKGSPVAPRDLLALAGYILIAAILFKIAFDLGASGNLASAGFSAILGVGCLAWFGWKIRAVKKR